MRHAWKGSVSEAAAIQKELRPLLKERRLKKNIRLIAGADVSTTRFSKDMYACVVLFSFPQLEVIERVCIKGKATFPYVPGYLSFREIPILLKAFSKLSRRPDVIIADGQGIAHPRRLGLAAHVGLILNIPTIGCAKSILYGKKVGTTLIDPKTKEVIAKLLTTKEHCKPVIISPGHRATLEDSVAFIKKVFDGYRIPKPTRFAHEFVNAFRRAQTPR